MYLLLFSTAVLIGSGFFFISCAVTEVPTSKTTKMMLLTEKRKGKKADKLLDVYITQMAMRLERYIHLDKIRRTKIQIALEMTGQPITITPEVYSKSLHESSSYHRMWSSLLSNDASVISYFCCSWGFGLVQCVLFCA